LQQPGEESTRGMETDHRRLPAATFLGQALSLTDDPVEIARDLGEITTEAAVTVYAAEVDSTVGTTAFLVYVHEFGDASDRSGRVRYRADLEVMETAHSRNAPGPRVVAHAATDRFGLILATTPATYQALAGHDADVVPVPATVEARREARRQVAESLLDLLREADQAAGIWLQSEAADVAEGENSRASATFSSEETELALFLLDERSIRQLLQVLARIITRARSEAARPTPNQDH